MEENHQDTEHHEGAAHGPAVSRRTVVILGGTALLAAALPAALFLTEPEGPTLGARHFITLLADPASAAELGEIWFRDGRPGEALPVYETRFEKRLRAHGWNPRMDMEETHSVLADAVRADYAAGRTVSVREWHLSETEADLCALAALEARRRDIPGTHSPAGDTPGDNPAPAHG